MKLNILVLSLLFSMTTKAECLNQKDYDYQFKYDKNSSVIDVSVKRKDNNFFYVYGDIKYSVFNVWYEVKDNEMTISSNIRYKENTEWFDNIFFRSYNQKELVKVKNIDFQVSLKDFFLKDTSVRYLNEERKIIPYLVIFQDKNLSCAYFEGPAINMNVGRMTNDINKEKVFKP